MRLVLIPVLMFALNLAAAQTPTFEERLAAADEAMATVSDLRADFEQQKKTTLLRRPLVSRGTVVCRAESIRWTTVSPHPGVVLVSPESITIHYPDDNIAEIYPADARFADAAGGPLPRLGELRAQFEVVEMSGEDVAAFGLAPEDLSERLFAALVPRSPDLQRHVSRVQVIIDTRLPCAERVIITDPDGDSTDIRFFNVRINSGVSDDEIKVRLPPGTHVSHPAGKPKADPDPDRNR